MHKSNKSHETIRGFTLIELVLVMGITVLFIAIAYATLYIVNTSHAHIAVMNDAKDFADLNMRAIENLLVDAVSVKLTDTSTLGSDDAGYTSVFFKHDNSQIKPGTNLMWGSALFYRADGSSQDTLAFSWDPYTIKGGTISKWAVLWNTPIFTATSTPGIIHVKLQIVDNATATDPANTTSPGKVYYTLEKDIILLNIKDSSGITVVGSSIGTGIKFKSYTP